jgi:hypothetical protein
MIKFSNIKIDKIAQSSGYCLTYIVYPKHRVALCSVTINRSEHYTSASHPLTVHTTAHYATPIYNHITSHKKIVSTTYIQSDLYKNSTLISNLPHQILFTEQYTSNSETPFCGNNCT